MTCLRAGLDEEPVRLVMRGQLAEAVPLGMARLERRLSPSTAAAHAALGQVIGRALIKLGREEEAEELFRRQLRVYEYSSRSCVRWMSSLDNGTLQLSLDRLGRTSEAFNSVADDAQAPVALRVEALAGLATCVRELGEYARAERTLAFAQSLAKRELPPAMQHLLHALRLETDVLRELRAFDEGGDSAGLNLVPPTASAMPSPFQRLLGDTAHLLADLPIASQRLQFLASLLGGGAGGAGAQLSEALASLRRQRLLGYERDCRIEAGLACVAQGDGAAAHGLLGGLVQNEDSLRRHRRSRELKYCLSRIYALQGRHADALRLYKEHVAQAMGRLRSELQRLPYSHCLAKHQPVDHGDGLKALLPMRYRRAYQYITEHLDDNDLSVREVAAHIDVTERALQMAFRTHLGMTPAELIRRRRMEHIRHELREGGDRVSLLDVARRWGMTNRSTLTQNYREFFHETPTHILRGGSAREAAGPRPEPVR